MSIRKISFSIVAALLGLTAMASQARAAAFVVNVVQQGSNVVATGSGTLNFSGLTYIGTGAGGSPFIQPSGGAYINLGSTANGLDAYAFNGDVIGPSEFGTGNFNESDPNTGYNPYFGGFPTLGGTDASSGSGTPVDFQPPWGNFYIPSSYVQGTQLSNTATFDNETFANMGLMPGTYVWTWGPDDQDPAYASTYTLDIVAVPEPASVAALGIPAAQALLRRRRRIAANTI